MKGALIRTLKASTFSNRGFERSEYPRNSNGQSNFTTLKGSTSIVFGHSFRVLFTHLEFVVRGYSLRSYPRLLKVDAFSVC